MPVLLLSRYLAQGRIGHLEQVYHIFGYLKKYLKSRLVFDDNEPIYDERAFTRCDWSEFYPETDKVIPSDMQNHLGSQLQ